MVPVELISISLQRGTLEGRDHAIFIYSQWHRGDAQKRFDKLIKITINNGKYMVLVVSQAHF